VPIVEVFREPGGRDKLRRYRVVIDGREVGRLRQRERASYEVDPGQHEITVRIDWCGSETLSLDFREGERVRLRCYPKDGFRQAARAMLSDRDAWIMLELVDS
jgi:hypothetical protein